MVNITTKAKILKSIKLFFGYTLLELSELKSIKNFISNQHRSNYSIMIFRFKDSKTNLERKFYSGLIFISKIFLIIFKSSYKKNPEKLYVDLK